MRIQVINRLGNQKYGECIVSSFRDPISFNDFDLSFILLNDSDIYITIESESNKIPYTKDFRTIKKMVERTTSKVVIVLPQNHAYSWVKYDKRRSCLLKDHDSLNNWVNELSPHKLKLSYDKTFSMIGDKEIESDFIIMSDMIHTNEDVGNNGLVTIMHFDDVIYTTLNLKSFEDLLAFKNRLWPSERSNLYPDWLIEMNILDDLSQKSIIEECKMAIAEESIKIEKAERALDENARIKAILTWANQDLADTVIEIWDEIFGTKLGEFVDERREDFNYEDGGIVYIGEIKGKSTNVRNDHIAQLELHKQSYLDDNDVNVKGLLIINHQRNQPIEERIDINEKQIRLAKAYGFLIIETRTLLKMFEKYRLKEVTREQCKELIRSKTGLLLETDLE